MLPDLRQLALCLLRLVAGADVVQSHYIDRERARSRSLTYLSSRHS
jgi:hypothetical protein